MVPAVLQRVGLATKGQGEAVAANEQDARASLILGSRTPLPGPARAPSDPAVLQGRDNPSASPLSPN